MLIESNVNSILSVSPELTTFKSSKSKSSCVTPLPRPVVRWEVSSIALQFQHLIYLPESSKAPCNFRERGFFPRGELLVFM